MAIIERNSRKVAATMSPVRAAHFIASICHHAGVRAICLLRRAHAKRMASAGVERAYRTRAGGTIKSQANKS